MWQKILSARRSHLLHVSLERTFHYYTSHLVNSTAKNCSTQANLSKELDRQKIFHFTNQTGILKEKKIKFTELKLVEIVEHSLQ